MIQILQGGLVMSLDLEHVRPITPGLRKARGELHRPLERRQCLRIALQAGVGDSQIIVQLRNGAIQDYGALEELRAPGELAAVQGNRPLNHQGGEVLGISCEQLLAVGRSLLEAPLMIVVYRSLAQSLRRYQ